MKSIKFLLNGIPVSSGVEEQELLLHALRERFSLKSVKEGCGIGECGTCTVLIDDEPHYACLTLASKVDGHDVKTVEFLGDVGVLHPLQEAFIKYGAVQCGFCTPGMLLSAYSLLLKNKEPDKATIKEAISGNLCRCTGYLQIEEAIGQAARATGISNIEYRISKNGKRPEPTGTKKIRSKEKVLEYLAGHEHARVIAGGTDLLVALRKGEVEGPLADISDVAELKGIGHDNDQIRIGAATTHSAISRDAAIIDYAKSLSLACGWVGSPQIRNMGTIGGNLVNASPAADSIPPLLIHDAILTLESLNRPSPPLVRGGEDTGHISPPSPKRTADVAHVVPPLEKGGAGGFSHRNVKLEDFIVAPYKTVIEPEELLTSVTLKALPGYREGYRRVTKRATWAIARLSLAWAILEEEGIFKDVRIAIGSCTPMPFRPLTVEEFLKGNKKGDAAIDEAVAMILDEIKQITGIRPSFGYKIPVLKGMLKNALGGE
jgi:xanthine dehydrogenase small subunit